jgi:hypothetical protein
MTRYGVSPIAPSRATQHAETCKTKVRSKCNRKINYVGCAGWMVAADGNLWRITACVGVAARLLAVGRCYLWAALAGTGQYDLFARHRTAPRRPPIGSTHMQAEPQQKNPSCDSVGHMLSASNTRDMFRGAIKSRRIGEGNSDMHFSVISVCEFRTQLISPNETEGQ